MDDWEGPRLWQQDGKYSKLLALVQPISWISQVPGSMSATSRPAIGMRNLLTNVVDRVQSPWSIGVGIALVVASAAGTWFFKSVTTKANDQVSKVETENARLIAEIDLLTRENETLQEGSDRASQLNTEVQGLLQAMQSADLPPEQMQGQLRLLLENLVDMVHRQTLQLQARNDELLAQTRMLREESLCKVCFEYPVVRSFNPCGHGTCVKCANRLHSKPCPFCRKDVESIIPRY